MIPAFALVMVRTPKCVVPLALPVFLAWPFFLVALGGVTMAQALVDERDTRAALRMARTGLFAFCHLSGFKLDVRSAEGERVLVWLF